MQRPWQGGDSEICQNMHRKARTAQRITKEYDVNSMSGEEERDMQRPQLVSPISGLSQTGKLSRRKGVLRSLRAFSHGLSRCACVCVYVCVCMLHLSGAFRCLWRRSTHNAEGKTPCWEQRLLSQGAGVEAEEGCGQECTPGLLPELLAETFAPSAP